jgi:pyridinium-3,5-bisthiocarboxylic acid mononucleotide nickel chelatase
LFAAGALDVSVTPLQMKKNRPGVLLSVQAHPANADGLEAILFANTTTLGVRRQTVTRTVLARETHEVTTPWGPVAGKNAYLPDGSPRFAPEYEACRRIANERQIPLAVVQAAAHAAFRAQPSKGC